jgi:hypothetical protein
MNRRMKGAGHRVTVPGLVIDLNELSGLRDEDRPTQ